ncbi:MAG: magnesium chelatase subunit D [Pseudomonadota bacterium]
MNPEGKRDAGGSSGWANAASVAALFAVDPFGTGGVRLRACPGPVRDSWLKTLRELLPPSMPWRRVPAHIRDDRLLGGLDLAATLQAGQAIAQRGVLAEAHDGLIEIAMAERLDPAIAARICAAIDTGQVSMQREGLRGSSAARFAVLALDEGDREAGEEPPASLRDRLAFTIDLHAISWRETGDDWFEAERIAAARERLGKITVDEKLHEALGAAGIALGVWSLRPTLFALRVARAAAALDDCDAVTDEHIGLAAQLVLAPRATRVPAPPPPPPPPDEEQPDEPPPSMQDEDKPDDADESTPPPPPEELGELDEQVLEAATAAIPEDILRAIAAQAGALDARSSGGKSGAVMKSTRRGRPVGSSPGMPADGARLAVLDTLRAAAPWQKLRRKTDRRATAGGPRLAVRSEDFRVLRFRQHTQTTTIFAVDASGSAALHRLAEAKGAVELLLADCYVRRDEVALIAFRGRDADLLLPPTRSLVRAKRELAGLPGGGGTPVAAGLDAARLLVDQVKRAGQTPFLVILTDGRANVARDGSGGRDRAMEEALSAARLLANEQVHTVLIDVSRKPQPQAATLAQALNARYLPLPSADAARLSDAIRDAGPSAG